MADFYLGQIITFGGDFAIFGTAMCNGQLLPIAQNQALFAVIGTTYGGDGISTFGLPNLQSRRMNHMGTGPGLGPYLLGQQSGVEQVTLTNNTMPAHTHVMTSSFQASGAQPHASLVTPPAGGVLGHAVDIATGGKAAPAIYCPSGTTANVALGGLNVAAANTGGSLPLQILTPYLAITMLIMLQGIFPSRN
ncbi:MAG TPA: tail fiber protein [Acetobacteraceae bacterium]|jgi:microcystin-dependent protein